MSASEPLRDRPSMPPVYGIEPAEAGGMLEWSEVADRLAAARSYWVATTRADGRPHVTPVWGLWLDGAVMFDADVKSLKALNLARDPRAVVHLESGDDVVIVEGEAAPMRGEDLRERYADIYEKKYNFRPEGMEGAVAFCIAPKVVLAWHETDFPKSATRFRFP